MLLQRVLRSKRIPDGQRVNVRQGNSHSEFTFSASLVVCGRGLVDL